MRPMLLSLAIMASLAACQSGPESRADKQAASESAESVQRQPATAEGLGLAQVQVGHQQTAGGRLECGAITQEPQRCPR